MSVNTLLSNQTILEELATSLTPMLDITTTRFVAQAAVQNSAQSAESINVVTPNTLAGLTIGSTVSCMCSFSLTATATGAVTAFNFFVDNSIIDEVNFKFSQSAIETPFSLNFVFSPTQTTHTIKVQADCSDGLSTTVNSFYSLLVLETI